MQSTGRSRDTRAVVFRAGSGRFAVPLEWVYGVLEGDPVSETGQGRDRAVYEGEDLPVIDVAEWLGTGSEQAAYPSLLILGKGRKRAAALVDSPERVVAVKVRELPSLCRPLVKGVFTGVLLDDDSPVLMVDPEGLMDEVSRESIRGSQGGGGQ